MSEVYELIGRIVIGAALLGGYLVAKRVPPEG